jgi:hypothetical protein
MKTIYLLFVVLIGSISFVHAQEPVPDPDTLKNQVNQKDPTPDNVQPDANYIEDKVKITSAEFPPAVKKTLNAGSEYQGWEKGTAYRSKDGKVYVLQLSEADTTRTFRFDKNGKLILD